MPAGAATVVFGLVAAITWGTGDFGGGLLTRRAPLFGVVLASQLVGTAVALILAVVRGETAPSPADLGWSVCGGLCGGIGISALYQGLAVGRMGIVAPITGVIAALIPVAAGIALDGLPAPLVLFGIGLAFVAVVLVSRVGDERAGPSGIGLALLAGIAIGLLGVAIAQISDGHVFGPLTVLRATEALLIGAIVIVGRQAWRPPSGLWPALAGVGVMDMAGNGAFILAVQAGSLAVAAVLSSLYPVTTVVLATIVLHERITRAHAAGIALAMAAIACIATGSS
ncbi:MAG: EamA family transporter [Candidatus Limnocylindrales bacterium]